MSTTDIPIKYHKCRKSKPFYEIYLVKRNSKFDRPKKAENIWVINIKGEYAGLGKNIFYCPCCGESLL